MKKTALVLVITVMVASFGMSQVLGPPNYGIEEKVQPKPVINDAAPHGSSSVSAECLLYGNCVIDYPGPNDNPSITSPSIVLSKAQIEVQPLPVTILEKNPANAVDYPVFRCVIVEATSKSKKDPGTHPRMICTTFDKNVHKE